MPRLAYSGLADAPRNVIGTKRPILRQGQMRYGPSMATTSSRGSAFKYMGGDSLLQQVMSMWPFHPIDDPQDHAPIREKYVAGGRRDHGSCISCRVTPPS